MMIRLTGKSLKGKNRVREHGDTWLVLNKGEQIGPQPCDVMLIAPCNDDGEVEPTGVSDMRWIRQENDEDFYWKEIE